jgi:hypothetical protein
MAGLPKKYAKMGFKRGWAAYNRLKRGSRKSKSKKVTYKMARRRRFGKVRKFYRKHSAGFGNIGKILAGGILAAAYTVYVSPMIPMDGLIKTFLEIGAGILLSNMRGMPTFVKSFGFALAVVGTYNLVLGYMPHAGSSDSNM